MLYPAGRLGHHCLWDCRPGRALSIDGAYFLLETVGHLQHEPAGRPDSPYVLPLCIQVRQRYDAIRTLSNLYFKTVCRKINCRRAHSGS